MPKLETVARASCVETVEHVQALLLIPQLTRNQFMALFDQVRQFLPAAIEIKQRMPKSVTTVIVTRGEDVYVIKVSNRARVTLA